MNVKRIFAISLLLAFMCFLYIYFMGNPLQKGQTVTKVTEYLISVQGYQENEFKEIDVTYDWMKGHKFVVGVTFKDEPDVEYLYNINNQGKVQQFAIGGIGAAKDKPIHSESVRSRPNKF